MTTKFSTHVGQSIYLNPGDEPPASLVDAVPGAREARDEWLALNAAAAPIRAEFRAAGAAVAAISHYNKDGERVPPAGVLIADLEAAEAKSADLQEQLDAHGRKALAALKHFDELVKGGDALSPAKRRALAAAFALEQQAAAEAAWTALTEALDARDEAVKIAGAPGTPWQQRPGGDLGAQSRAKTAIDARLRVDLPALRRVAAGADVEKAEGREQAYGDRAPRKSGFDPSAGPSLGGGSATRTIRIDRP
jgi:hypothetical protein